MSVDETKVSPNYTNNNLFHALEFNPSATSFETYPKLNVRELPCFNQNPRCSGETINGFCDVCQEVLLKININTYIDTTINNCPREKKLPFPIENMFAERQIFPILSMQGILDNEDLMPLRSCIDSETSGHAIELLRQLSLPTNHASRDASEVGKINARAISFQQAHTPIMRSYLNTMKDTTVRLWFTKDYLPQNILSSDILSTAKDVKKGNEVIAKVAVIPIGVFENIIDIYNMKLFPSSVFEINGKKNLQLPNVQIVNGWIHYGYGFGAPSIPKTQPMPTKQHLIGSDKFGFNTSRLVIIAATPLTMDGTSASDHDNLLTAYPNSKSNVLQIEDLSDVACTNYNFLSSRN
ncbi:MAG: hypothetical protein ACRYGG_20955 [Janthinobacterium lividum]